MTDLIVHAGGWSATKADLASVALPEETESYIPISHTRLIEELSLHLPRFGLNVTKERYALAREGAQMFGILTCANGTANREYSLALGIRNSYDKSFAVGIAMGASVFVCDNLSFSGELQTDRRHTTNLFRDLPDLIYKMLSQVGVMKARQEEEFMVMKRCAVNEEEVHDIMIRAVKADAFPASKIPRLIEEWEHPKHPEFNPRNCWSLYNAFTEVQKSRSPQLQMDSGLRITQVFRDVLYPTA